MGWHRAGCCCRLPCEGCIDAPLNALVTVDCLDANCLEAEGPYADRWGGGVEDGALHFGGTGIFWQAERESEHYLWVLTLYCCEGEWYAELAISMHEQGWGDGSAEGVCGTTDPLVCALQPAPRHAELPDEYVRCRRGDPPYLSGWFYLYPMVPTEPPHCYLVPCDGWAKVTIIEPPGAPGGQGRSPAAGPLAIADPLVAAEVRRRAEICAACPDTRRGGRGCAHWNRCCFVAYRQRPQSCCPAPEPRWGSLNREGSP